MVAQVKFRRLSFGAVSEQGVMSLVANAFGYRVRERVRTTWMSVGEMAVHSLVKPFGDAAEGKRRRGHRVQTCLGTGQSERFGPYARDHEQVGAVKSRGQICRVQPWVENSFYSGILPHN